MPLRGRGRRVQWARDDAPPGGARTRPGLLFRRIGKGPPAGGDGGSRPTGPGRGCAPLCGAGMRPPLFFVLTKKSRRRSGGKETALCPNPAHAGRFGQIRESCESVRRKLGGFVPGALYLMGTGKIVPAFEGSERLSGWLSYGCCSSFRAPRFATRYREVNGAAAEVGAGQIGFAARLRNSWSRAND